jgi:hypothetical protein
MAALTIVLVLVAYLPGLHGAFLFDDAANLPIIGASGPVDNSATFFRYITAGTADPLGRPVSLLSFLVDARDWPADPFAFKRSNLILHIVNGLLLGVLLTLLGKALELPARRSRVAALVAASIWTIHPFFVSTVLYVVQREAMLPATWTLLGMLCWLRARRLLLDSRRSGYTWLLLGVGACTLLATLSKANGLLLPLLIVVVNAAMPRSTGDGPYRKAVFLFLAPASLAVVAFLGWHAINGLTEGPIAFRGWSVGQRLLTEPSILLDYLSQLAMLRTSDSSLLHDDISVAKNLWAPWYTLPALIACLGATVAAWLLRRSFPIAALATLFFFAGHLMESSSLALELYFDHRNYLPAMLLFWPLGIAVANSRLPRTSAAIATAVVVGLAFVTRANAVLWGNPLEQAMQWAASHPTSARAQAYAAQMEMSGGYAARARARIDVAKGMFSNQPQIGLNLLDIHCSTGGVTPDDVAYAATSLRTAPREPGPLLVNWFNASTATARHGACPGLTREALETVLDAAAANPVVKALPGRLQDIAHIRGAQALAWNEQDLALTWFDRALAESPNPGTALSQAAALGNAGFPEHGLRHLRYFSSLAPERPHTWRDGMPWIHDLVLDYQGYWPKEISHLSNALTSNNRANGK